MKKELKIKEVNALTFTPSRTIKLTPGQTRLLELISECVNKNKTMDTESIVDCYCKNIKSHYYDHTYGYKHVQIDHNTYRKVWTVIESKKCNIIDAFKEENEYWKRKLRQVVKLWTITNIGTLVLKGKLVVIPKIEDTLLNEE